MPGLLKKDSKPVETAGATAYRAEEEGHRGDGENAQQPRQPASLQGLLRFAMDTTRNEDAPGPSFLEPLDDERKKFLEDALKSMTIDVIELLLKQIKVFDDVESVTADGDAAVYTQAFETILDYVENIDVANDFYKIGGFTIFNPCFKCGHAAVRAGACEVLSELCQNNPYCQKVATDNDFIPTLVRILDYDEEEVCVKALYALSSIVRDNEDGFHQFLRHNGLDVILKTIKKKHDKLRTKSSFFLCAICQTHADLKERMINLGFLQVLMAILGEEHSDSHEHVSALLKCMVEDNPTATYMCRESRYDLLSTLKVNWDLTKDKEECQEEHEYCKDLLDHLFPDWAN